MLEKSHLPSVAGQRFDSFAKRSTNLPARERSLGTAERKGIKGPGNFAPVGRRLISTVPPPVAEEIAFMRRCSWSGSSGWPSGPYAFPSFQKQYAVSKAAVFTHDGILSVNDNPNSRVSTSAARFGDEHSFALRRLGWVNFAHAALCAPRPLRIFLQH